MEPEAGYGQRCTESFAVFARDLSSWRMSARSLFGDSIPFSGTWPRAGTMRNGRVYRRVSWERRNKGIDSGLWPTPTTGMSGCYPESDETYLARAERLGRLPHKTLPRAIGGRPNPRWVEWLMGFPIGWQVLSDAETPSPPKSQNGLAGD